MVGVSVGLGFPLGVAGGFLDGLNRFYINNWTSTAATFMRATLIVYALKHGRGLLTVAFITVIFPLLTSVVRFAAALSKAYRGYKGARRFHGRHKCSRDQR